MSIGFSVAAGNCSGGCLGCRTWRAERSLSLSYCAPAKRLSTARQRGDFSDQVGGHGHWAEDVLNSTRTFANPDPAAGSRDEAAELAERRGFSFYHRRAADSRRSMARLAPTSGRAVVYERYDHV